MVNCIKCGKDVSQPVKTWRLKQTLIALYECPACNAKWRSKLGEDKTTPSPKPKIQQKTKKIKAPPATKEDPDKTINTTAEPDKAPKPDKGIEATMDELTSRLKQLEDQARTDAAKIEKHAKNTLMTISLAAISGIILGAAIGSAASKKH